LHVIDGDLANPKLPLVPGHEIVGEVVAQGAQVDGLQVGQRVGVPWLGFTCGECRACAQGRENLCERALFTGYTLDGGYADYAVANARYCLPLPAELDDEHAAPLLCAGLIGYRALKAAGPAERLGIYGFGAAAHIILQVALAQGREVHAFVRPGDEAALKFAREMGVHSAGYSDQLAPEPLDAAILFAPVGSLVPLALGSVHPGGTVVTAGIHMSQIPAFDYSLLWGERTLKSVANLTRADGEEFLPLAQRLNVVTNTTPLPLEDANVALERLRTGHVSGALVLVNS
jgi:propanol-preferring alcohol dehydrogenase